jgi:hypothetical protein
MKHAPERLREVYNKVCISCGYENFIRTPGGARLERLEREASGFSHLTFAGDRIQFTEDHVGISVEQFARKVSTVLQEAMPILRIPVILVQQSTVRMIATPNIFKSAAELFARSIFRVRGEDLELLGRPGSFFGFRQVFPATAEHLHGFNVRVESYIRDPRSLYIENVATFNVPIQLQSLQTVERNLELASQFLVNHVLPFLSRYDRKENDL